MSIRRDFADVPTGCQMFTLMSIKVVMYIYIPVHRGCHRRKRPIFTKVQEIKCEYIYISGFFNVFNKIGCKGERSTKRDPEKNNNDSRNLWKW